MNKLLCVLFLLTVSCSPLREIETTPHPTTTAAATETTQATATEAAAMQCTVTADKLHLRSGAGIKYPVKAYLYAGDVLTLNDTPGKWIEVTTQANVTGWINSNYCKE